MPFRMFVILQKYDFSSKSQPWRVRPYCWRDVCDTAKVRFFKQITTCMPGVTQTRMMFVILQKYDFSSKSQRAFAPLSFWTRCLWYCKSTIFQANHNWSSAIGWGRADVCDTAKVRFFKQITTRTYQLCRRVRMFVILQKYDFSSKSQQDFVCNIIMPGCLWYCKSTIFQANHNGLAGRAQTKKDVCDTAKVRFFKQITTLSYRNYYYGLMFVILQKYDFSSKSQPSAASPLLVEWCLWYCKSTIFQANHNEKIYDNHDCPDVCDTAKVRFFKQITTTTMFSTW